MDDLDATVEAVVAMGATVQQPVTEVGGGRRIAVVADPDDNRIGLLQNP